MYALIKLSPLEQIAAYGTMPPYIRWASGDESWAPRLGTKNGEYIFATRIEINNPPTSLHSKVGETLTYDSNSNTLMATSIYAVTDLTAAKKVAKNRITEWRRKQQDSGFSFNGKVYDSDPISRSIINGAVTMALISIQQGQPYNVSWTTQDNSQVDMDANTIIAFGIAAATSFQALHAQAISLKTPINTKTTPAEIQAVLDEIDMSGNIGV